MLRWVPRYGNRPSTRILRVSYCSIFLHVKRGSARILRAHILKCKKTRASHIGVSTGASCACGLEHIRTSLDVRAKQQVAREMCGEGAVDALGAGEGLCA